MEFACHTWAFNDLTLPEALGTIARLGFRYVDLATGPHLNIARAARPSTLNTLIDEFRNDLDLFNLKPSDLYLMLPRISVDDEAKREGDIAAFKALLTLARALSIPGITLSPGLVHPEDDLEAWDRTAASLREMLAMAQETEIPLSIEPHMDSMVQTPDQARKMLKDVPGLKLTLDWAHLICKGIEREAIIDLLPEARHVQIRPAAKGKLQLPLAESDLDPAQIISALKDAHYTGVVCIEYMQTKGWHDLVEVNSIVECAALRDALRDARNAAEKA